MGFTINDELDYSNNKYNPLTTHFASFRNETGGSTLKIEKTSIGTCNSDGSANLVGNGTTFLSDVKVNDEVYVDDVKMTVLAIADDTHLSVDANVPFGSCELFTFVKKRVLNAQLYIYSSKATRLAYPNAFVRRMNISGEVLEDQQMTADQVFTALYAVAQTKFNSTTPDE